MRKLAIILLAAALLVLAGCVKNIDEVKSPENVGKNVAVKGTVEHTIKLGKLSGYTIKDSTGSIGVSSQSLPAEGSKVTVKGTLVKDTLLGYYIVSG